MLTAPFKALWNRLSSYYTEALSASAPRIWCASLWAKPRDRCQPFGANSKISYKVGNLDPPPSIQIEAAAAGPSFLAAGWPSPSAIPLSTENSSPQTPSPAIPSCHPLTVTITKLPVLSAWIFQDRCGLLCAIINHIHKTGDQTPTAGSGKPWKRPINVIS